MSNVTRRKLNDPEHLQELLTSAVKERDALLAAAKVAVSFLTSLGDDMRERAKELEGENRTASSLLNYYAPEKEGRAMKALWSAIAKAES